MNTAIQTKIEQAIHYHDATLAQDILKMAQTDPGSQIPRMIQAQLKYIRAGSLHPDSFLNLMRESVLASYSIPEYDLEQRIIDKFDLLEYPPAQVDFLYKLKTVLEQSQELLGNQKITINDKVLAPTIGNWLLDYKAEIGPGDRDALGVLRYINKGSNIKVLSLQQRKILQNIIRIYDETAKLIEFWELIPDALPPDQMHEFEDWAEQQIKQVLESAPASETRSNELRQEQALPKSPARAPQPQLPRKPLPIIATQPDAPPLYKIGTKDALNLQTHQKKGLIYDTPTNIDIDKEAKAQLQRQAELLKIQVKLDDLNKRKKKNNS